VHRRKPLLHRPYFLCELAWILESNYRQNRREIADVIEALMQVGQLEVMEPDVVWRALRDFMNSNVDFPDHLLASVNNSKGCTATITFDKKAVLQPPFQQF
jgi:predicted nucleic-acid-binding protein